MTEGTITDIECPRCHLKESTPLAKEGDLQRFQCEACGENFSGPASVEPPAQPQESAPPAGIAHAPISAEAPIEVETTGDAVLGRCPKCQKPYQRLGKFFERHVETCPGTPYVEIKARTAPPPPPHAGPPIQAPQAAVSEELARAVDISIEALESRRRDLQAAILAVDQTIATLRNLKGPGGAPQVPFPPRA